MPDGGVSLVLLAGGVGKRMGVSHILMLCQPSGSLLVQYSLSDQLSRSSSNAVQAPIPKQYLTILGQPIATYSLQTFASMREIGEIVVVCEPDYK